MVHIFQPQTVLGWHRQLVKRKWTYSTKGRGGRPKTDNVLERLVVQNTRFRFLIRDRDTKFTDAFDTIFRSEGLKVIRTPRRAPNANSHAERWILSAKTECLDKLIFVNQRHLHAVLTEFVDYYNNARPHQGIDQQTPILQLHRPPDGPIERRDVLGGNIHDYYREVA